MTEIVLASGSPRRRTLLTWAGLRVEVRPGAVPEVRGAEEDPVAWAARLAWEKALAAGERERVVVAADTVVHQGADHFDKPRDRDEAREHLRRLSEAWHDVTTAVCVLRGDAAERFTVTTRVRFRALGEAEIEDYVASGDADDKAGAYRIQGRAGSFVAELQGDWTNVMGLPLERTLAAVRALG